ncbi:hypothetical protein Ancab_005122, partial [Ancistrocladus abbreviatus]
ACSRSSCEEPSISNNRNVPMERRNSALASETRQAAGSMGHSIQYCEEPSITKVPCTPKPKLQPTTANDGKRSR